MPAPTSRLGAERIDASTAVVEIEGEHDLHNAPALREEVDRLLGEGRAVVVDLGQATFVDSSVLATLLDARRSAERAGLGFAVCVPEQADDSIARIMQVTGMDRAIPVRTSRHEAIADVRSEAAT